MAHGIASSVGQASVCIIGSAHFVFEDEGMYGVPAGEQAMFDALPSQYSAICIWPSAEQLAAVICIADPLRE